MDDESCVLLHMSSRKDFGCRSLRMRVPEEIEYVFCNGEKSVAKLSGRGRDFLVAYPNVCIYTRICKHCHRKYGFKSFDRNVKLAKIW